jgi:hypothetical protein
MPNTYQLQRKTFLITPTSTIAKVLFAHDYLIVDVIANELSVSDEAALKRCSMSHYETAVSRIYNSDLNLDEGTFTNGVRSITQAGVFASAITGTVNYRLTVVALVKAS